MLVILIETRISILCLFLNQIKFCMDLWLTWKVNNPSMELYALGPLESWYIDDIVIDGVMTAILLRGC